VTANSKLLESHERWRAAQPALVKEDLTASKQFIRQLLDPLAAPKAPWLDRSTLRRQHNATAVLARLDLNVTPSDLITQ